MKNLSLIAFLAVVFGCTQSDQKKIANISGVWKLIELSNYDADGQLSQPFGNPPLGYFIYTPEGHMSIQIMKNPPIPPLTERPNDSTLAVIARGSLTYFGTYSVDEEAGIVTHEVEGALNPNYVNTNRDRKYSISGDTLTIDIQSGESRYKRVLLRVE